MTDETMKRSTIIVTYQNGEKVHGHIDRMGMRSEDHLYICILFDDDDENEMEIEFLPGADFWSELNAPTNPVTVLIGGASK